jgi:enoyl-CoA hydratase/carnithine racemase
LCYGAAVPDQVVLYDVDGGVATITLNDPETRNSLSPELLDGLLGSLRAAREDDDVRCVVLASSHERVFSSGANLGAFGADVALIQRYEGSKRFVEVFKTIGELGKPTIVAANGHVLAGSLGIALACDLIIAKVGAGFGTPEINVGLFPFMIMALIYRNVARKKTNEMLLLGERLSAEEAQDAGIVNKVVPAEEFDEAVREWATKLASKSPVVMQLGKDAMWRQMDMPLADALDYLCSQLTIELGTEDAIEGVTAFFEKREPNWKGR